MELLALYIYEHYLFDKPVYFNFGGKYLFDFKVVKDNFIKITRKENKDYIPDFYNKGILNINAIVGNNGVGKTSILKIINRPSDFKCILIYLINEEGGILIDAHSGLGYCDMNFDYRGYLEENELLPLYYSSQIDYNLMFSGPINQVDYFYPNNENLAHYHFDNIVRQMFFLHDKSSDLKKEFKDLPTYEKIIIEINNIKKEDFINHDFFKNSDVGKNVIQQLHILWDTYESVKPEYIHDNSDFIKSFEVFILSLFITDDLYTVTNSNGNDIDFRDVLKKKTFEEKLIEFLKKRINNIDGPIYNSLNEKIDFNINDEKVLIDYIKDYRFNSIKNDDFEGIRTDLIKTIRKYFQAFRFYKLIISKKALFSIEGGIDYSFSNNPRKQLFIIDNVEDLKQFFELYLKLHDLIQYQTFNYRIFKIRPDKKLSSGEQSLLNFYSSIHNFTLKKEHPTRQKKNYLLLLDEPETGYHAVWKKKFIDSINKILPELFKDLKHKPKIQIIFTTHDALTLSDIPNTAISYMKKQEDGNIHVYKHNDIERPSKSFGANITDLLADSFFVEDGLIGDFAKEKINETIKWLNDENRNESMKNYHFKLIKLIDEPIVQRKLSEMYDEVFNEDFELRIIERQIKKLEELKKIKNDSN